VIRRIRTCGLRWRSSVPENQAAAARTLLDGKVTAVALALINQMVAHPRGRPLNLPWTCARPSRPGAGSS